MGGRSKGTLLEGAFLYKGKPTADCGGLSSTTDDAEISGGSSALCRHLLCLGAVKGRLLLLGRARSGRANGSRKELLRAACRPRRADRRLVSLSLLADRLYCYDELR